MPENWEYNESAGNIWLRELRTRHESLSLRKLEATNLTQTTSASLENVKAYYNAYLNDRMLSNPSKTVTI
jgi:hypothetical protein